ncbi:cupin-like domain-containing protein [Massilia sp. CF038]|uniref:cupin-like domain-containing protein n=1 Tax=Massilia sp. CF038 TaxID=1881045 RepID=UPI001E571304|nr:cupin-like domain-containing protein [Massilia sp. CF038]
MTTTTMTAVPEWHDVDAQTFATIQASYQPAILRGFVRHWPSVRLGQGAPEDICNYLIACDSGAEVDALLAPAAEKGRLFYQNDMNGFNFARRKLPVSAVIEQLARYSQFAAPPSVAVQSALIDECLPRFAQENVLPLLDAAVRPRIWLGNTITTPAHFDESNNIACVVAGKRRFTLFPPEQVANLYIGPLDFAPTPTPISMVDFNAPDFERFPRFREALANALVADLAPGDALYIPTLWWHHVQSTGILNILVNYWWRTSSGASPFESLVSCMQNLRELPPEQRKAWAAMFAHYVFDGEVDPGAHIPEHKRGVLAKVRP